MEDGTRLSVSSKDTIVDLISQYPKHYTRMIKKNDVLYQWVIDTCQTTSDHFPTMVYSAVHGVPTTCVYNNEKKVARWGEGLTFCGPASSCKCTKEAIASSVSDTKSKVSDIQRESTNKKRESTMIEKYGVAFNSQRTDIKHIWNQSKAHETARLLLEDEEWMYDQYVTNHRSASDIAQDIDVYYGTVIDYCRKYGFDIRQTSNYSVIERQIADYCIDIGVKVVLNDREVISPKEIDIYIPSHKIGIEVNGLYWHSYHPSSGLVENKNKHVDKTNEALANDTTLLHFTDYDWVNKRPIVESMIQSKLGMNTKIAARKTTFVSVSPDVAKSFFNNNHLHGHVNSTWYYGLEYQGELLMVMSFGRNRFSTEKSSVELYRMATARGSTTVGGVSKILTNFKKNHGNPVISTYCSRDFSIGTGYQSVGFEFVKNTKPGYFWTDGTSIISRYKSQRRNMKKWLSLYEEEKSESENMFAAGFRRYWDTGNSFWILKQ